MSDIDYGDPIEDLAALLVEVLNQLEAMNPNGIMIQMYWQEFRNLMDELGYNAVEEEDPDGVE